jgi:hypothetical protein
MQLWLRRFLCIHFGCLTLVTDFTISSILLGQDPPLRSEKPNALRSPDRSDAKSQEPPMIEWEDRQESTDDASETQENSDDEDWLIIGSADTRLLSGNDSEKPEFVDLAQEEEIASDENNLALAFELANASFAPSLSVYSWLIRPTLIPYQAEEPVPAAVDESEDSSQSGEREQAKQNNRITESKLEPPELLSKTTSTEVHELEQKTEPELATQEDASIADRMAEDTAIADAAQKKEVPKKPAALAIRTPFENEDSSDLKGKSNNVPQHDPDSLAEQDEPKIDASKKSSDKELQGVDALKASKPGAHRREIRIAAPSLESKPDGQSVPSKSEPTNDKKQAIEPELERRLLKASDCLKHYLQNPESTSVRSPWAVMHALIAFGSDYELVHGQSRVNAIGWMCHNGTCRTQRMFTPKGRSFIPNVGGGVQGHEGQFLAILAQSNVPLDYPIQIGASKFKVEDLVRYEMATCKEKSELTFKLIGLSYYLDSNKQWKANDGKIWSIPKLIQEELAQPVNGSACGGTHRLMGFSFSVRQRQLQNQPINGQYARAAKFVREYVAYTLQLQNPDGSFSTDWYEGRANEPNEERKVQTSGHMLEWLMFTLTDEEIKQPKIAKGIDFLLSKIYDKRDQKWPIGPRGHATRAVALYHERMTGLLSSSDPQKSVGTQPLSSAKAIVPAPITRK